MAESTIKNIIGVVSNTYGDITAKRSGNVVTLSFNISSRSYLEGWNDIGTIGSEYRPHVQRDFLVVNNAATSYTNYPLQLRVNANGVVRIYSFGAGNLAPLGTVTYIV